MVSSLGRKTTPSSRSAGEASVPGHRVAIERIAIGLSELGPLSVLMTASVPGGIVLEPNSGLAINDFTAGIEFFKSLPSIEDPFELRSPEFGPSTELTAEQWLNSLQAQVVAQFNAIKANPALGGFGAAFGDEGAGDVEPAVGVAGSGFGDAGEGVLGALEISLEEQADAVVVPALGGVGRDE